MSLFSTINFVYLLERNIFGRDYWNLNNLLQGYQSPLLGSHFSVGVLLWIWWYFLGHVFMRAPLEGCFSIRNILFLFIYIFLSTHLTRFMCILKHKHFNCFSIFSGLDHKTLSLLTLNHMCVHLCVFYVCLCVCVCVRVCVCVCIIYLCLTNNAQRFCATSSEGFLN